MVVFCNILLCGDTFPFSIVFGCESFFEIEIFQLVRWKIKYEIDVFHGFGLVEIMVIAK
jgi:hypothetical protein